MDAENLILHVFSFSLEVCATCFIYKQYRSHAECLKSLKVSVPLMEQLLYILSFFAQISLLTKMRKIIKYNFNLTIQKIWYFSFIQTIYLIIHFYREAIYLLSLNTNRVIYVIMCNWTHFFNFPGVCPDFSQRVLFFCEITKGFFILLKKPTIIL